MKNDNLDVYKFWYKKNVEKENWKSLENKK